MSLIRPTGTGLARPTGTGLIRPANVGLVRTASGTSGAASAYATAVLADTPAVYLRFDDSQNTTALDSSVNALACTYVNTPVVQQAPLITNGTSVLLAAASQQYARVPAAAITNAGNSRVTLEVWVKSSQSGASTPQLSIAQSSSPNNRWQFRISTGGKLEFILFDNADNPHTATGTVTINDGARHHCVGTYDGATMLVYVDGAVDGAGTAVAMTLEAGAPAFFVGAQFTGAVSSPLSGNLDEFAMYTSALSSTRIAAHYAAGIA